MSGHPLAKAIRGLLERNEPIGRMMAENLAEEFDRLHKVEAQRDRLLAGAIVVIECKDLGLAITLPVLEELRAAIAECRGGADG